MTLVSKLRTEWRVERPADLPADFESRVFAQVCGLQPNRPGNSQDEALRFSRDDAGALQLEYVFDHDYASQYDRTERWFATVTLTPEGPNVTDWRAA